MPGDGGDEDWFLSGCNKLKAEPAPAAAAAADTIYNDDTGGCRHRWEERRKERRMAHCWRTERSRGKGQRKSTVIR